MARIDKTEDEILRGDPQDIPQQETARETLRERLEAKRLEEGAEPYSRIYRIDKKVKNGRVYVGSEYDFVFEEYVAENYGPGSYFIAYNWKENGRTERNTSTFTISDEYGRETVEQERNSNLTLSGFLGSLTKEKITLGIGILQTIRDVLAPPQPQIDIPALITALNTNKAPSVSDSVLVAAMDSLKAQSNKNSISQQIQDLKALKELTGDNNADAGEEEEKEGADDMDLIIKTGLKLLPELLQKNNGNYQAAGEEARKNATVNALLMENKDLAQKFFEAAAKKYGDAAAMQLAEGFGFNITREQPAAQIATDNKGAANG